MRCANCDTEFVGDYCPSCGHPAAATEAPLPEICGRCGTAFRGRFCPNCGWAAGVAFPDPQRASVARVPLGIAWTVGVVLFLLYLALLLGGFLTVIPAIWDGILAGQCAQCLAVLYLVNPFSELFFVLLAAFGGTSFLAYFLFQLGLLITILVFLILRDGRRTVTDLQRPLGEVSPKVRSGSRFVVVGQVFMAIVFFQNLYFLVLLPALGIVPESPFGQLPPWYLAYSLVDAAIWEEVAFRFLLIGIPMAIGSLILRVVQVSATSPLEGPRSARRIAGSLRYLLGGAVNGQSSRAAQLYGAALVLLSALLFGYIHVVTWGVGWKFVDTFIGGLALGYLFLRRGIVASILLHFSINAAPILLEVLGGETSLLALAVFSPFNLVFLVLGFGYTLFYLREIGRFLTGRSLPQRRVVGTPRTAVSQPPQAQDPGLYPVSCPQCGAQEAIYAEGRLTCAQCGHQL